MIDSEVEQQIRNATSELARDQIALHEPHAPISDLASLEKAEKFMKLFHVFERADEAEARILKTWIASAFLLDSKQPESQLAYSNE